jgi:toxin ParE1/3/4
MTALRTPQADHDLDGIWGYIATESGSYDIADRLVDTIVDRFLLLATHPHIGRARDEDLRPGLRSFPVGNYIILYRVHEGRVLILRILHGNRDIHDLLIR